MDVEPSHTSADDRQDDDVAVVAPDGPGVTFFRLVPGCRVPQRADRSAAGTMPTRAFRYCEAMTSASAFGWYVFPPISFSLIWEGGPEIIWSYSGVDDWYSLKAAQVPNFAD